MPFPERLTQLDAQLGGGFTGVRWQASSRWPAFSVPHVKNPLLSSSVLLSHTLALPMGNVKPWFEKAGSWVPKRSLVWDDCKSRQQDSILDRGSIPPVCSCVGVWCSVRRRVGKNHLLGRHNAHGMIDSWRRMGLVGRPL